MTQQFQEPVLVLVGDLMLGAQIRATARAAGVPIRLLRDPAEVPSYSASSLIVDLNVPGAIEAAQEWQRSNDKQAFGYVHHADTETIDRAREAGVKKVMARSHFVNVLPDLLASTQWQ